jgi:hypothetical protein
MLGYRRLAFVASVVASSLAAPAAHADRDDPELDGRSPVRVGGGYSELYRAPVLVLGYEVGLSIRRLSETAHLQLVLGMEWQRGPRAPTLSGEQERHYGFTAYTLGTGVLLQDPDGGPALVLSATLSPLSANDSDNVFDGIGMGSRIELYPFYQTLLDSLRCRRGLFATYFLGGLSTWATAREDWIGSGSGRSLAAGASVDISRALTLPLVAGLFDMSCKD